MHGALLCAHDAIKEFLDDSKTSAIVTISSAYQIISKPRLLLYSVSRGGMQNLTRTMVREYAGLAFESMAVGQEQRSRRSTVHPRGG
jgi:glucose 1-dehydrogenase